MPKLTKKLRAGLKLLATAMPDAFYNIREKVTGRRLMEENPGVTHLKTGSKIDPRGLYGRPATRPINHANRLFGAFERAGRAGVLRYCQAYIEAEHFGMFSEKLAELVPES